MSIGLVGLLKRGASLVAMLALGMSSAVAAGLITPIAGGSDGVAASPTVAASQLARIDSAGLVRAMATSSDATPVVLDLMPGVSVRVVRDRTDPAMPGMSAFAGHTPGDPASSATIVVHEGTVYAVIQTGGATYQIDHRADGVHTIRKIDQDRFPGDKVITPARPRLPAPDSAGMKGLSIETVFAAPEVAVPEANTVIRVGILVTTLTRSHHTNWASIAQASLTDANTAFSRSGVTITFANAGIAGFNYNETGKSFNQVLSDATASAAVASWRNSHAADLISVFRDDSGRGNDYCGLAWYHDTPSASTKGYAHSVVNIACAVDNHSFAHELGHNMGLKHDRYAEGKMGTDTSHYNYGYSNVAKRARTIMAYADYCYSKGVSCTRIGYFSNPYKAYNGGVLGVKPGVTNAAHNAARLNQTKAAIAAYK